jgi:hypothetical protein
MKVLGHVAARLPFCRAGEKGCGSGRLPELADDGLA